MPSAVPYTPRGFVPDRYEPNSGRLVDLARSRGRDQADAHRRGGEISANLWSGIGQNVAGTLRELAAMPEQARRRQMEEAAIAEQEYRRQQEFAFKVAEAEQRQMMAEQAARDKAESLARTEGNELGGLLPPGPINEGQLDTLRGSPAQAGRTRYSFGPGTAEGPELMPTQAQIVSEQTRKAAEAKAASDAAAKAVDDKRQADALAETIRHNQFMERKPTGGSDNEPLETIIGPDGKPVRVRRSDAIGKSPASGTEKPSSGVQKRVLNFFNRAEQADKDLEGMEADIQKMNLSGQAWMAVAPNFAQTQTGQAYTQAQRAFTEARLRKDSGAAIPNTEFDNDRKTYFAQPGDSKETLEQKRRARAAVLASLAFESGQALGEFLGNAEEAARVIETYKTRAAKSQPTTKANPFRK